MIEELIDGFRFPVVKDAVAGMPPPLAVQTMRRRAGAEDDCPLLKGNDVQHYSNQSNGYRIEITGPSGRERYVLRHKGRIVGRGDLRQALAKGSGRERVKRFERRMSALMCAEARLRKFTFDSRLTEKEHLACR